MKPWEYMATTEVRGIISFPGVSDWSVWDKNEADRMEKYTRRLEDAAQELLEFLRDHRSRDSYDIDIERTQEVRCRYCGQTPEPDEETGEPICCGLAQEHWMVDKLADQSKAVKGVDDAEHK